MTAHETADQRLHRLIQEHPGETLADAITRLRKAGWSRRFAVADLEHAAGRATIRLERRNGRPMRVWPLNSSTKAR